MKRPHWIHQSVLLSLTVAGLAACDHGTTEPAPATNHRPTGEGALPWDMLNLGDIVVTSVSPYFRDPDDDLLDYLARSRNPGVVTAGMKGGTLVLRAVGQGVTEVLVTARDPEGLSASRHLVVTVAPTREAPAPRATGSAAAAPVRPR